jgi:hypothetical protein
VHFILYSGKALRLDVTNILDTSLSRYSYKVQPFIFKLGIYLYNRTTKS